MTYLNTQTTQFFSACIIQVVLALLRVTAAEEIEIHIAQLR